MRLETHGHVRVDDYYWMRDDKREDREILRHLAAENDYTSAATAHVAEFKNKLFEEIKGRIHKDDSTVPYLFDGYWYYRRYQAGGEYPLVCRRKGTLDAPEHVILDVNAEAEAYSYYDLGNTAVTKNGRVLAYSEDTLSRRIYTIRFRDLDSGNNLDDVIEGTSGALVWALDNRTVFYVRQDETTLRPYQVWRHTLGTPQKADVLVFEETDDTFWISVWRSKSQRFIFLYSSQTVSDEVQFIDAMSPTDPPTVFYPRERDHEYTVDHVGDRFYIRTNHQATNFRIMSVAEGQTADRAGWREELAHRDDTFVRDFVLFDNHIAVSERYDANGRIRVMPRSGGAAAYLIPFDEAVYTVDFGQNPSPSASSVRLAYSSLTTPASVIDFDLTTRERELMKQDRVLGGFDSADYVSERLDVVARDGTRVPISMVYRKDLDRSVPQPLLQYGYGSYGITVDPYFASPRLSLLDRGVIYAITHVRGSQAHGRKWYDNGKLLDKRNTFNDFVDCSEALIERGYTTSEQLSAMGGSAGGLLMGAVVNMRPDLYRGIIASVPFVDVVTTMLDESIPLTTFEYDEWGNPNDKRFYEYMLSYSPVDNIEAKDYPDMLVLTGLHDSQVQYWEPAKWVAKLRANKTDNNQVLFHVNMDAGHGGASGRYRRFEETALTYAWLLDHVGIRE